MKENKIAFIICVTDQNLYQKSLSYINKLEVPEGIEIEIIAIMHSKSLTSAYNEAMHKSDSKYKVYLHEDVYIQNTNFINDILNIFKSDQNIGLIGVAGAKIIPVSGIWQEDHRKKEGKKAKVRVNASWCTVVVGPFVSMASALCAGKKAES